MAINTLKASIAITLLAGVLLPGMTTQAYPPFLKASAKFGAKDCLFCHMRRDGAGALNKRGKWLVSERDKRKAEVIDVAWLSDYGAKPAGKATAAATPSSDNWAEMESFNEVMSQTFHPVEEGNFAPIRQRAGEMAEKAGRWRDSKPPKIYDLPEIKANLIKLAAESKTLAEVIGSGANDEKIKTELTALHDRFHQITGACRDAKKKPQ